LQLATALFTKSGANQNTILDTVCFHLSVSILNVFDMIKIQRIINEL